VTLQRQLRWGQTALFASDATGSATRRYRVHDGNAWGQATTSLPLAVAQARAVALRGATTLLWADDGTAVTVTRSPEGFVVASDHPVPWASQCRSLLDHHG
jgi:hypothetical protein